MTTPSSRLSCIPHPQLRRHGLHPPHAGMPEAMSAIVTRVPSHTQPQGDGSRIQTTHIALKMCHHVAAVHSSCLSLVPQPQRRRHGLHPPHAGMSEAMPSPHRVPAPHPTSWMLPPPKRAPHHCHPRAATHNRSDGPHTPTTHIALQMCRHCCGNPPLASIVCSSTPTTTGAPPRLPDRGHKGHALSSSRIGSSFLLSDVAPSPRSSSLSPVCSHTQPWVISFELEMKISEYHSELNEVARSTTCSSQ